MKVAEWISFAKALCLKKSLLKYSSNLTKGSCKITAVDTDSYVKCKSPLESAQLPTLLLSGESWSKETGSSSFRSVAYFGRLYITWRREGNVKCIRR